MATDNKGKPASAEEKKAAYQQAYLDLKTAFGFEKVKDTISRNQIEEILQIGNNIEFCGTFQKHKTKPESLRVQVSKGYSPVLDFTLGENGLQRIRFGGIPVIFRMGGQEVETKLFGEATLDTQYMLVQESETFGSMGFSLAQWSLESIRKGEFRPMPHNIRSPFIPASERELGLLRTADGGTD